MALGDFLRDERARRGQNYREFAELCGISVSALRWIEDHPEADPGLSVVMKMADGLEIPRWQMLEHAGYPSGRGAIAAPHRRGTGCGDRRGD